MPPIEVPLAVDGTREHFTFATAKRRLERDVYFDADSRIDIYCGCAFDEDGAIDASSCGIAPRRNAERAMRMEWEHMVPAARFGQHRACWRGETCANSRGRACCSRSPETGGDVEFRAMEGDLHNLAPAAGELNGDRSNRAYGIVAGEPRAYGACDFEVDFDNDVAEPADSIRGDVARAWLYMAGEYGMQLTPEERAQCETWHADDPPDAWELLRDERIDGAQGNANAFVGR